MRIFVLVKPGRREERVGQIGENRFVVSVIARAHDGQANTAVIKAIARHFRVPKIAVAIRSGLSSRSKQLYVAR